MADTLADPEQAEAQPGLGPPPDSAGGGASDEAPSRFVPSSPPEPSPGVLPAALPRPGIVDVWSRTEPKYRIRTIGSLGISLLLFCVLCVFTHWLHVARPFDFTWASYAEPMRFWGPQSQTLYNFVLFPISVERTPIHGVVLGLLLASIVAVPIVVSILYRFVCALPFVAAVLVFAHLPGMAAALLASCILASVRPFRMSFRFSSALLAMLPVLAYFFLATRGSPEQLGANASPTQKATLNAPWVLAILAACLMMGATLLIARIVNYRPGAVAPVMAVMFATPAMLFARSVGVDELAYRMLEAEYGPRSARFTPVQDATPRIKELMQRFDPQREEVLALWGGELAALKRRVTQRIHLDFLSDRRAAYEACRRFIADHPKSRYVPNVLYIQARTMDTRLDERRLNEDASRELYTDFPHAQAEEAWAALLKEHAQSPLAVAAGLRLAQLYLRRGTDADLDRAMTVLAQIKDRPEAGQPTRAATQPTIRELLRADPPETGLGYEPKPDLFRARQLYELIAANRDDPRYGNAPLRDLLALDSHRPRHVEQLLHLMNRYPGSHLDDELAVTWASNLADRAARADRLEACLRRFPDGQAAPEALFRLADLEIQTLAGEDPGRRERGIARMRAIVASFASSCWARAAADRLQLLEPVVTTSAAGGAQP